MLVMVRFAYVSSVNSETTKKSNINFFADSQADAEHIFQKFLKIQLKAVIR